MTDAVSVDPDAINKYIAERIIESALGERLHQTVEDALKALGSYGNDPMKSAVTAQVQQAIRDMVATDFADTIRERVRALMTDEFLDDLVARAIVFKDGRY